MTREEIINGLIHIAAGNWDENSMATITEAITILESQPALPGGLEEAAMRDSLDYVDSIPDGGTDKHPWNDHDVEKAYYDGMLAGAKWQAEQGGSIECEVVRGAFRIRFDGDVDKLLEGLGSGDKVIVQIRKK